MKVTLIKVRSSHSNIGDKYTGVIGTMPKTGDRFVLYLDKEYQNEGLFLQTTPVTACVMLSPKVYEFETKNSKYSLELQDA